jgi:hypothetical protein
MIKWLWKVNRCVREENLKVVASNFYIQFSDCSLFQILKFTLFVHAYGSILCVRSNRVSDRDDRKDSQKFDTCVHGIFTDYWKMLARVPCTCLWLTKVSPQMLYASDLSLGFVDRVEVPLVLLLNQWYTPPLRLQVSDCSTFRTMCDAPSTAVFFVDNLLSALLVLFTHIFSPLVTIPVAYYC